jgi:hypothetical protein
MPALFQNEIAERRGCWTDERGVRADAADGPVGVTAMAGRHVVSGGGVLAVAARSHVHGDPLALREDLHGAVGEPHLDLAAREAVGNAVELALDIDVVVDADPAHAPFREDVRLGRQRLERGLSSSSSSCRRVTPRRRIGRSSLSRSSSSPIAAFSSARL